MNTKTFIGLIVVLLIGAGFYYLSSSNTSINTSDSIGSPIVPGLLDAVNDISVIKVTKAGNEVVATLKANDGGWVVAERNDYPADVSKVRTIALALAQANIIEEKTSNPTLYNKLGVENIDQPEAQGMLVEVDYGNRSNALIVGNPGPQLNKNRYVRLVESDTSWLVDKKIDVKHDTAFWVRKDLFSVEPNEVAVVTITMPDNSELIIKNSNPEEDTFVVANLSDPNSQVIDAELHQVTNALSSFQLLDVVKAENFLDAEPTMVVDYQLKQGADIKLTAYAVDKDHFMSIDVKQANPESGIEIDETTKQFVADLQSKTSGWVFKIPNVSYDSMYKREPDVLAITEDQLN
ncbi:MAG: DUF4340 domain-containing protein [Pseudomonadota bacterium]